MQEQSKTSWVTVLVNKIKSGRLSRPNDMPFPFFKEKKKKFPCTPNLYLCAT